MTLHELLTELREEIAAESPLALNSHAMSEQQGDDGPGDEGGIGRPLTSQMHRLLKHPDWWRGCFLGRESVLEVRDFCQARHPTHRMPGTTTSTCHRLVYITAVRGHTPLYAAMVSTLPAERAEILLLAALRHAKDWRHRQLHKAIARIEGERTVIRCRLCPDDGSIVGGKAA